MLSISLKKDCNRPIRFRFNKQDRIKNFSALKQSFEGIHDLPGSQVQSTMAWRN